MKLRPMLIALLFVLAAALGAAGSSCGGDDSDSCDGRVLTAPLDCSDCSCPSGQQTTCTAFPKGDESSNQRCCSCN